MQSLTPIKEYAKEHAVPIMKDEGIEFICKYIEEHKIKRILEIGSAIGYSAIKFAGVSDDICVTTLEIDKERYEQAVQNIKAQNLENRISIYLEDALLFETEKQFDLIFIDAAKSQYIRFFEKYKHKQVKNAMTDLLPQRMIDTVLMLSAVSPEKSIDELTREERAAIAGTLKCMRMTVKKPRPIDEAIITHGGVSVKEIDPREE